MTDETRAPLPESQPPTGETPRTDALIAKLGIAYQHPNGAEKTGVEIGAEWGDAWNVAINLARQLERELAAERDRRVNAELDRDAHKARLAEIRSASGINWQHFDAAYAKACESSEPKDWMQAALFAQQVRNAVSTTGLSTEDAARLEAMTKATYSHVDGRDLLHQLQPNGAHHIDIVVRINGEDRRYDGDWLKTLTHARDGHNMGEYADNPKLRAHIEAARAAAGDSNAGEASGALSATGTTTKEKT